MCIQFCSLSMKNLRARSMAGTPSHSHHKTWLTVTFRTYHLHCICTVQSDKKKTFLFVRLLFVIRILLTLSITNKVITKSADFEKWIHKEKILLLNSLEFIIIGKYLVKTFRDAQINSTTIQWLPHKCLGIKENLSLIQCLHFAQSSLDKNGGTFNWFSNW